MKWIKGNKLIILLTLLGLLIVGYPLFALGIEKTVFLSVDPDIVYVTNALLYAKYHLISYIDHPGTPSITLFYYSMVPLQFISKYFLHQNFIQWSFDNYLLLTYYLRIFQLLIFSASLFLFIYMILNITKSYLSVIIAFLLILLIGDVRTYIYINPETFSIFLTTIWLLIFTKYYKNRKLILAILLSALAGFAFANKFTNLVLVLASLIIPVINVNSIAQSFKTFSLTLISLVSAFFIAIWPVRGAIRSILNWVFALFTHTDKYGKGPTAIFDLPSYLNSANNFFSSYYLLSAFILLTIILSVYLVIQKEVKISNPVFVLSALSFLLSLIFIKYSTVHYLNANIFILIYCFIYLLTKLKFVWSKLTTLVLSILFLILIGGFVKLPAYTNPGREYLNKVLEDWTVNWSADVFREQFDKAKMP